MREAIGILDLGIGNLGNVARALSALKFAFRWVRKKEELEGVELILFPGVGAFPLARERLVKNGLWEPLKGWLEEGRPYLGICLGYQLLFEYGEEWGGAEGLGFFPGRVTRLDHGGNPGVKIPHIGWNELTLFGQPGFSYLSREYLYFVHSFAPPEEVACEGGARTTYGRTFLSLARRGKAIGVQFHPERSGPMGLRFLREAILELLHA